MIIDCFPFFNELDLLEIRLHELSDIVDVFVLSEATLTFTGKPKPLYYADNKDRFSEFSDRIEHIVIDTYEGMRVKRHRRFEWDQKQCGLAIMIDRLNPNGDDIIHISDVDEIPRATKVKEILGLEWEMAKLQMPMFYYWMNCYCSTKIWNGGKLVRFKEKDLDYRTIRYGKGDAKFKEAGWHFSYLTDIKTKMDAIVHEWHRPPYNTVEHINARKEALEDLYDRGHKYELLEDLSYLPQYVLDNKDKFGKYLRAA